jgi:hypothetical protein
MSLLIHHFVTEQKLKLINKNRKMKKNKNKSILLMILDSISVKQTSDKLLSHKHIINEILLMCHMSTTKRRHL